MNKVRCAILVNIFLVFLNILSAINDMPIIASFQGEHYNSGLGFSMVSLDFNHDGYDDLAISSPNYGYIYPGTTHPSRGKLYLYYGTNGFNSNTTPSLSYEGTFNDNSGRKIHGLFKVGDISGDGFDDLCVYVEEFISWNESYEKLLFFYGDTSNLDNPDHVFCFTVDMPTPMGLYSLGDVNGDGHDDIGISYPSPQQNKMSIIWGGSFTEHIVSGGEASFEYSCSINGIGDINNDGFDDFTTAFATPTIDPTYNLIRLYYGNPAGSTEDPIILIQTTSGVSRGSKALGDMNADGYDDFMGYITDTGMHAWLGGTNIDYSVPSFDMDPRWYGGEFQKCLEHGDFNNDGFEDAAGASFGTGFAVWLGKQHVNGTADFINYNSGYENYGYSLVTGDFNIDGYDDIAVAASHEYAPMPTGDFLGYVWVFGGNAELEDTTVTNVDLIVPGIVDQMAILVSPNPLTKSGQNITISIKGIAINLADRAEIEIFNIKGQSVLNDVHPTRIGSHSFQVTVASLSNGIYFCKATTGKYTAVTKFSVIK